MKLQKLYIIIVCALLAFPAFATGGMQMQSRMQQNTQEWTQNAPMTGDRGGAIGGGEEPTPDPGVPAGETAWTVILGLGLAYGTYVLARKRKEINE